MNSKSTWIWIVIAAGLAAFMWVSTQMQQPPPAPPPIVPKQLAASVTSVNVHPSASSEIRAELTNGSWHLAAPISTPAQGAAIQTLLAKLAQLAPARYLTAGELRDQPNATEEYGLVEPQFSVTLQQADARRQLRFGIRTAPGDQVFLQVVGIEGVYVVDAEILKWLPHTAADWRDPGFVDLRNLPFDRLDLTNGATAIELQVDPAEHTWRMTRPLRVRADSRRINELLVALQRLRVTQFVTDEPKAERERFGLQPAELTLALSRGTNPVRTLLFGKSPTNDATQVFACREDFPSIVTVAREAIEPWRALPNAFRDHQLISVKPGVEEIEFKNGASFTLRHAGTNAWSIAGEKFPVDAKLAGELVQLLDQITILQFRKDIVTEPDLPDLGLATPALQITFRSPTTNGADAKPLETRLAFSAPQGDTVNVRRSDEDAVYAVALSDFLQLPTATWQLRERRIWNFSPTNLARIECHQGERARTLVRVGTNSWALGEGSQGVINGRDIETTAELFSEVVATVWDARSPADLAKFGFGPANLALTFELKDGTRHSLRIGGKSATGYAYASVELDGETWVLELPFALQQFAETFLALPEKQP